MTKIVRKSQKKNSPQKNLRKIYTLLVEVCFQDNKRPLP